jgi:hypothetical protein
VWRWWRHLLVRASYIDQLVSDNLLLVKETVAANGEYSRVLTENQTYEYAKTIRWLQILGRADWLVVTIIKLLAHRRFLPFFSFLSGTRASTSGAPIPGSPGMPGNLPPLAIALSRKPSDTAGECGGNWSSISGDSRRGRTEASRTRSVCSKDAT